MKKLLIILFILFASCSRYNENVLFVTRKYCGNFDTLIVEKKFTKIYTTQDYFYIVNGVNLQIPKDSKCYVKYIEETLSGQIGSSVWILYFTWDGMDDLYMLKQNFITGKIIR